MSKFVKFVKENKKIIGIVSSVVVVAGVAVGVICATADKEESTPKTTKEVATSTVAKEENEVNVVEVKESDLEKAQKDVKEAINQDYFAKEDGIEVHCKKDADSKVVKTLKYNESILVYGKVEGNWYLVDVDGEPGYISNEKDPMSAYDIEKKKADDEAAKKAQEEAEKQAQAAQQAAAQQQAHAKQSQSSSNQSQQQTQQSQQQTQQTQQPQQTGYTEGYDATKTQEFLSYLNSARSYYGPKCADLDAMLERVYNGSISPEQAKAEMWNWRWQDSTIFGFEVTAAFSETAVVKTTIADMSGADFSFACMSMGMKPASYMNLKVYRNADGSLTVTYLSAEFMQACN